MKKINLILVIFMCFTTAYFSQSTTTGHIPGGTRHLGWDDTGAAQLRVTQNNQNRMLYDVLGTWNGLFGETATNVNRITLPHTGTASENQLAWSMLHLWDNDGDPTPFNYGMQRPWMDVGVSMTSNFDFMYLGFMERPKFPAMSGNNRDSDMVLAWGCQDNLDRHDDFRFLYLENWEMTNPSNDDRTMQGRELMRLTPWGNLGVGNFSDMTWAGGGAGLNESPTHTLDVDGQVRIRQMAYDSDPDILITGVEVNQAGDYELQYAPLDSIDGFGEDCNWEESTWGIFSGAPSSTCNDLNVGIGATAESNSKLLVDYSTSTSPSPRALSVRMILDPTDIPLSSYGIQTFVYGTNNTSINRYGHRITSFGAKNTFGVHATAI